MSRFNTSVESGNFNTLVDSFAENATMSFEDMPFGPFRGRNAIASAYHAQPPDDTIEVVDVRQEGTDRARVEYAWMSRPDAGRGEMLLSWGPDERVTSLVVRVS
ncbi:hypothetical protein GCM10027615_62350 [Plantactinospora veratri]